jgi:hypothetical protein
MTCQRIIKVSLTMFLARYGGRFQLSCGSRRPYWPDRRLLSHARKYALRLGTPKDENVVQPDIVGWHRGRYILGATSLNIRRTGIPASTPNCRSLKREARGSVFDRIGIHVSHNFVKKEWRTKIVHQNVAGLDVDKKVVAAAIIVQQEDGTWLKVTRSFGTMTADLLELSDWLMGQNVRDVAMESTGEYWKPVFNILAIPSPLSLKKLVF